MPFCCYLSANVPTCSDVFSEALCHNRNGIWSLLGDCTLADCLAGIVIPKGACCDPNEPDDRLKCSIARNPAYYDYLGDPNQLLSCVEPREYHGDYVTCGTGTPETNPCVTPPPPPPPNEDGCVAAAVDRINQGDRLWHRDMCQTAFFTPLVDPATDAGLVSTSPIRALPNDPGFADQPCALHRGYCHVAPDGHVFGSFCGVPEVADPSTKQWTIMEVYVNEEGDSVFAGAYKTPWISEVRYHSHKMVCLGPEV